MFGLKPIELILILAVGYLLYDKFKGKATASPASATGTQNTVAKSPINNTGVADDFDAQVDVLFSSPNFGLQPM